MCLTAEGFQGQLDNPIVVFTLEILFSMKFVQMGMGWVLSRISSLVG